MPRPDFIQAPTLSQYAAAFILLRLNRRLVAGRYGDLLPPDLALEFRDAIGVCERQFDLSNVGNDNADEYERDLDVLREVLKS